MTWQMARRAGRGIKPTTAPRQLNNIVAQLHERRDPLLQCSGATACPSRATTWVHAASTRSRKASTSRISPSAREVDVQAVGLAGSRLSLSSSDALNDAQREALLLVDFEPFRPNVVNRAPEEVLALERHRDDLEQSLDSSTRRPAARSAATLRPRVRRSHNDDWLNPDLLRIAVRAAVQLEDIRMQLSRQTWGL